MRWFVLDVEQLNYYKLKDAKTMFKEVDVDNSGYLDEEEVVDLCRKMGKKLNRKAIQAAMQEMDSDNSGQVDFEEFDRWWASNGGKNASEREAKDPIVLAALTSVMASGDREILITGPSNKGGGNRTYTLRTLPDQLGEQAKWLEALQRLCPSAYEETREGVAPDPAPASHQQQYDGASQFGGGSAGVMDGPVSATFTQPGSLGLGLENTEQSDTILIKTVVAGGAAEHIAGIRPGLQLLRFNGVDCAGKSYAQVIDMLKGAGRPVTLDFITPAQSAVAPPPTASAAERQAAMAAVSAAPAPTAAPASAQASQHSTEFRAAYKQATEAIKDAKASQRVEGADPAESARKYERAAQLARAAADLASEENYRTKLLKTAEQCASIASKNDAAASPAAWSPQPQPEPEPEPEPEQAVTGAGGAAPSLLPSVGQALPAGDSVPAPIPAPAPAVVAEGWGALPQSGDVGGGWGTDSHAGLGQQATAWGSYASDGSTPTASDGSADKVLAAAAAAAAAVEEAKAEAEKASAQARAEERATEQRQAAEKQAALRAENEALEEQRALAAEDAEAAVAAAAAAAEATAELQTELQAARAAQAEAEAEMAAAQATKDAVATEAERAAQQAETEQKAAVAAAAAAAEQAAIEKAAAQQALEAQQQQLQQLQQQLQQQQQRLQKQQASPMVAQLQELVRQVSSARFMARFVSATSVSAYLTSTSAGRKCSSTLRC
eukprot:COSAG01_NODE_50_length_31487_cov_90.470243_22_plen_723_part_00